MNDEDGEDDAPRLAFPLEPPLIRVVVHVSFVHSIHVKCDSNEVYTRGGLNEAHTRGSYGSYIGGLHCGTQLRHTHVVLTLWF